MDEPAAEDAIEPVDFNDFENLVGDDVQVEQLLLDALQSSLGDSGEVNTDVLEELGRDFPNIDFAALIQQLQNSQEETDDPTVDPLAFDVDPLALDDTEPGPMKNESSPSAFPVPSPAAQEIEIVDLDDENESPGKSTDPPQVQQPVTIIKAEGGITVCHGGEGDLRPKCIPTVSTALVQNQVSEIKVEIEPEEVHVKKEVTDSSHTHHRKDKKKNKEKDKDPEREKEREKHREERERKKRLKEEKERERLAYRPPRHPAFLKHRKKFTLLDTSVTLIKIDTIIPVSKHMRLKRRRLSRIEETDRKKQSEVNNKTGRVRLVPRPRPAYEYEKIEPSTSKGRQSDSSKSRNDLKRKKIQVFSDSSESDTPPPTKKTKDKSGGTKDKKPHGEFSATGARILPFEKGRGHQPAREESLIKRPKMPESEMRKEVKRERNFRMGNEESEKKVQLILQEAIAKQKAHEQSKEFKIPKANVPATGTRESELEIGRYRDRDPLQRGIVSTTTPLNLLRQEERKHFEQGRKFAPNSYGQHRYGGTRFGDGPGNDPHVVDLTTENEAIRMKEAERIKQRILMRADADQYGDDDEAPADMHDDAGSEDDEVVEIDNGPATNVTLGPLARNVCDLLIRRIAVQYPTTVVPSLHGQSSTSSGREPSLAEITIHKCAWWFQGIDKQSFRPILTEPVNPEVDDMPIICDDNETVSSFGHVSNPGAEQCQINEITSSDQQRANNPDVRAEFCGRSLIDAQFRISADDKFQKVLDCPRGTNYDRNSFTGTCTICKVRIKSKRDLAAHVISEDHRTNFKKLSLNIMPHHDRRRSSSEEVVERVSRIPPLLLEKLPTTSDKDKGKGRNGSTTEDSSSKKDKGASKPSSRIGESSKTTKHDGSSKKSKHKDKEVSNKPKESSANAASRSPNNSKGDKEEKVDRVARSGGLNVEHRSSAMMKKRALSRSRSRSPDKHRRRSRSPRYARRSRSSRSRSRSPRRRRASPRRRSTSAEKVAKFLERTRRTRSPANRRRRSRSGSMSPVRIRKSRKHLQVFSEKLKLQAAGKWTLQHEENWRLMEAEEKMLDQEVSDLRDLLCDRPEEHPKYEGEWQAYWEKTYHEVELSGQNADTFDYVPGWKTKWAKRAEELMEEMHYDRLGSIRVKYGMDVSTLQRLLLDLPARPPPLPVEREMGMVGPPVLGQGLPLPPPLPGVQLSQEIYTPFDDDLQPRAMSLSGTSFSGAEPLPPGVAAQGPPPGPAAPIVTIDTVQKTWALLTGQAMNAIAVAAPPRSDRSGSSVHGLDLEMELIEVLRLMNSLEDQLSILAPQVEEYFKRAETMELVVSRKSYDLLEDKDFVALLFQCRDKFMSLIRANILTREVLKRMNKAVFGLTSLLDSEPCQRLRPKQPVEIERIQVVTEPVVPEPEEPMPDFESMRRPRSDSYPDTSLQLTNPFPFSPVIIRPFELSKEGWDMMKRIRTTFDACATVEQKHEVAKIIQESFAERPVSMTDRDLIARIYKLVEPALKQLEDRDNNSWGTSQPERPTPVGPFRSADGKRELVRGMGTALPPYPELQCRAMSPPRQGQMMQHFQPVGGRPPLLGPRPGGPPRMRMGYNGPRQFRPRPGRSGRASLSPARIRDLSPRTERASLSPSVMARMGMRNATSPHEIASLMDIDFESDVLPEQPTLFPLSRSNDETEKSRVLPAPTPLMSLNPLPGPSKLSNVNENIPPKSSQRSTHQQTNENRGKEEASWDEVGSVVSSGSIAGSVHSDLKRPSRSTVSIVSTGSEYRSQLKEKNKKVTTGTGTAGTEYLDALSDVESGEILSSDDGGSVSSLAKNRPRQLKERLEAMKLVKEKRRERRREGKALNKNLEKWFEKRHVAAEDHTKVKGESESNRKKRTLTNRTREKSKREQKRRRSEIDGDSSSNGEATCLESREKHRARARTPNRRRRLAPTRSLLESYNRDEERQHVVPKSKSRRKVLQEERPRSPKPCRLAPPLLTLSTDDEVPVSRAFQKRRVAPPMKHVGRHESSNRSQSTDQSLPYVRTGPTDLSPESRLERRRQRFQMSPRHRHSSMSSISIVASNASGFSVEVVDISKNSQRSKNRNRNHSEPVPILVKTDNHPAPIPALDAFLPVSAKSQHWFEVVSSPDSLSSVTSIDNEVNKGQRLGGKLLRNPCAIQKREEET